MPHMLLYRKYPCQFGWQNHYKQVSEEELRQVSRSLDTWTNSMPHKPNNKHRKGFKQEEVGVINRDIDQLGTIQVKKKD